jgi:hypothetical protein
LGRRESSVWRSSGSAVGVRMRSVVTAQSLP